MRAALYSPYLDSLGGGERYTISFGKVLLDAGWEVDLESKDKSIISKLENRFGLNLAGMRAVDTVKRGDGYDLCFWLSDGSVPTLMSRKNVLHFQRPFYNVDGRSLINRMKFFRINCVVVNSQFTKQWIDREYPCKSIILYPPVDVGKFKPGRKENLILYVGRFSQLEQSKGQDVLVKAFKKLYNSGIHEYRLVLAGGSEVGRTEFVDDIIKISKEYPVEIIESPDFNTIRKLYSKAKIFWSAVGFGYTENKEPKKMEHFGIAPVEAMAAGCLPMLFFAGGHKEIIEDGKNGFLWHTTGELIRKTKRAISDRNTLKDISKAAEESAGRFSYEKFSQEVLKLL